MWGLRLSAGLPVLDSLSVIHGSLSRGFRRPSMNDLYWPEDDFARGNPDLLPETSVEMEAGMSITGMRGFSLSLSVFQANTSDLIRWEPGQGGLWSPVNITEALRRGIETDAWIDLRAGAGIDIWDSLHIEAVAENLLDAEYVHHLTREAVLASGGLDSGDEVPASGRWFRLSARWEF